MFAIGLIFLIIWAIYFLFFSPAWLFLLIVLPFGVIFFKDIPPAYQPCLWLFIIPLLVIDIQTIENGINFKGVWQYISWLPVVILLGISACYFSWKTFHFSFGDVWGLIGGAILLVVIGKLWISDPLMLFINRLSITQTEEIACSLSELSAKRGGRSISYYLLTGSGQTLEISGLVYFYLKSKKLNPGDKIIFKFKTGLTGVIYASGFPRIA